jgi:hypothetical protein
VVPPNRQHAESSVGMTHFPFAHSDFIHSYLPDICSVRFVTVSVNASERAYYIFHFLFCVISLPFGVAVLRSSLQDYILVFVNVSDYYLYLAKLFAG